MDLKQILTDRGISKSAAAAAAGVSPSYISQVLSGKRHLSPKVRAALETKLAAKARNADEGPSAEEFTDLLLNASPSVVWRVMVAAQTKEEQTGEVVPEWKLRALFRAFATIHATMDVTFSPKANATG